jgi:hypothetical protein
MDSSRCPYCKRSLTSSTALNKHLQLKVECKTRNDRHLKRLLENPSNNRQAKRLKTSTGSAIDVDDHVLAVGDVPEDGFFEMPTEAPLSPPDDPSILAEEQSQFPAETTTSTSIENVPFETDIPPISSWMEDDTEDLSREVSPENEEEDQEEEEPGEGTGPSLPDPSFISDEDYDPNYLIRPSVLSDNAESIVTDTYPDAATVLEKQKPRFARILEEQKKRGVGNVYHPFGGPEDWSLAQWMYLSGVSQSNVDTFLSTDYVSKTRLC